MGQAGESRVVAEALGEAEVGQLHTRARRRAHHQQVRRLDVAMNIPFFVGVLQRRQQLHADPGGGGDGKWFSEAIHPLAGVLAGDVFHDQLELAVDLDHVVVGDDVGMPEVLEDLELAAEIGLGPLAGGDGGDHHLDRHMSVVDELAGEIDFSHAPPHPVGFRSSSHPGESAGGDDARCRPRRASRCHDRPARRPPRCPWGRAGHSPGSGSSRDPRGYLPPRWRRRSRRP